MSQMWEFAAMEEMASKSELNALVERVENLESRVSALESSPDSTGDLASRVAALEKTHNAAHNDYHKV